MTEDNILTHPSAHMARMAPAQWDNFKAAFRKYTDEAKNNMVKASPEQLAKTQGMAAQCVALLAIFEDAIAAADRMAARKTTR